MTSDHEDRCISLLYVEDERDTQEMVSEIIRHRYPDMRLILADNGKTGLALFIRHLPEIVMTDINMPIKDGITMSAEIKSLRPSTEVIALTAYSNTEHLLQAIEIGISHYLMKPVDIELMLMNIDKVLSIIKSEQIINRQREEILSLNAELAQKAEELELKNQELETFDYTVAHDLRSHILKIDGITNILLDKQASVLDGEGTDCLRGICREISSMDSMVKSLLTFSVQTRKKVGKKWTNLSKIVNDIRDHLQTLDSHRHVVFSIAEGVKGFCDPDLMLIVLENLLGNAWKYTGIKDEGQIEFGTINMENDLVYFVRDNGAGFDPQDAAKLFVPFHRLKSHDEVAGFGIGLATVHRIIQSHGGKIWAEGHKGKEATFYFTL